MEFGALTWSYLPFPTTPFSVTNSTWQRYSPSLSIEDTMGVVPSEVITTLTTNISAITLCSLFYINIQAKLLLADTPWRHNMGWGHDVRSRGT